MRVPCILSALVAATALSGCIVAVHDGPHGQAHGYSDAHGHAYIYYPAYHSYYCTAHDDWWCLDGGTWVYMTVRPPYIDLHADIAWVEVDVDGPEPFVHYEKHRQEFPEDSNPGRGKGPPPGRGRRN